MSTYKDIYRDYPVRCGEVWVRLRGQAEELNRDVTFMLMTAAGGLAMPWEHLRKQKQDAREAAQQVADQPTFSHPLAGEQYEKCLKHLRSSFDTQFGQSALGKRPHKLSGWYYNETPEVGSLKALAEYGIDSPFGVRMLGTRRIVNVFRNALAHNNIYAFAKEGGNNITHLAFYSLHRESTEVDQVQPPAVYRLLVLPTEEFGHFLDNWFDLIRRSIPKTSRLSVTHLLHESLQPAA